MPQIHSTALVSDNAQLAPDVEIGPFAIIESHVTIGAACHIASHAKICSGVTMGAENTIGHGAVIGGDPQDLSFDPLTPSGVLIGNHNSFREHVTINRSTRAQQHTVIGDHNFLMAASHLAHDVCIADHNILANNVMIAGHCQLGSHIFLGGGSAIHQFIHIGDLAMIQGNSGMTRDIPPYCIVHKINQLSGLNTIGLKRAGFSPAQRTELKKAYALLLNSKLSRSQALIEAEQQDWSPSAEKLIEAVRSPSSKGILTR